MPAESTYHVPPAFQEVDKACREFVERVADALSADFDIDRPSRGDDPERIENEARPGFFPFTEGGWRAVPWSTLSFSRGSGLHGINYPTDQLDHDGDTRVQEWRDAVRDADPDPAEPYEWWRVSEWLCEHLRDAGEVVIDNGYGHWWGRCCTGQSIILDGTIQRIAHGLLASR